MLNVLTRFFQLYFVFTVVCGLNPSWHFTVQYSIIKIICNMHMVSQRAKYEVQGSH